MVKTRSQTGRLIVTALMVGFLLLACSAPPPSSTGTTGTSAKPSGSLVVAWSQILEGIDNMFIANSALYTGFLITVFDGLATLDWNNNVAPGLAERWEISNDGLTHTFYIRKGVKFHDGSPLTAADVKFSMDRLSDPEAKLTGATEWRTIVSRTEVKDDYTVVVSFKTPQFDPPRFITDFEGTQPVLPKKYIEEKGIDYWRKNPVGSGPWKVVRFEPGLRIELEANESYWDTNLIPKFKNLTIITVREEGTKVAMLKTGEADMADVSAESAAALKAAGLRIKAWNGGSNVTYTLFYDTKNPTQYAFGDLRVRKATSLAINRKELADTLFGGYAAPGIVNRVQPTWDFYDATVLKADPYDPEGAKKLLAEAGYPSGFNTKIWDTGAGGFLSTYNQALAGYWRKVGINATLDPIEQVALSTLIRSYSDPRVWNSAWSVGIGAFVTVTPVTFDIVALFHSTKGFYRNSTNKRLDELLDLYPATKDPAEKRKIAREATILGRDGYTNVSVLMPSAIWALGSKVGDLVPIQGQPLLGKSYATVTHAK